MENRFETFTVLISKISRSIRRIKTGEMAEYNLKSPHVTCLYYLYKNRTLTATELCELGSEDKAATSRSLDYLEKEGFITCDSNLKKRYKNPLILTSKGEEVACAIAKKIDNVLTIASDGLSEENRKIFYESLSIISSNLENLCKNYMD